MKGHIPESELPPEPKINPEFEWIWKAWQRLHRDRPQYSTGQGPIVPGNIDWRATVAWAEYHRMTHAEHSLLDLVLISMDDEYLAWWTRQLPKR